MVVTVIASVIGFLIGAFIGWYCTRKQKEKTIGTIRADSSDPDSTPYLFLEIYAGKVNELYTNKTISLDVDLNDYISQK